MWIESGSSTDRPYVCVCVCVCVCVNYMPSANSSLGAYKAWPLMCCSL